MDYPSTMGSVTLLDYQQAALPNLMAALSKYRAAIDASDLGTGKTYLSAFTAAIVCPAEKRIVVVCPKAVKPSWTRVLTAMGLPPDRFLVTNYESIRTKKGVEGIIRWEDPPGRFRWQRPVGFIIFDEAHKVRSYEGTANSKLAIGAKQAGLPHLFLSATLAESPAHLRAIGLSVGLHSGHDFFKWALANGCTYDPWGKLQLKKSAAGEVTRRLNAMLFPERGVRVRKADLPNFPEDQIIAEALDFNDHGGIDKALAEMAEEVARITELEARDEHAVKDAAKPMVARLRARQKVELLKVPVLMDIIEDALDEGMAVAVFVNFTATLEEICERGRKWRPSRVQGGQAVAFRDREVLRFQHGETHLIVVNIASGGAGIGLHDEFGIRPRLALHFPGDSSVNLRQATGRCPRQGSKSKTLQKFLFAAGTVEMKVFANVRGKLNNLDAINDADLKHAGEGREAVEEPPRPAPPTPGVVTVSESEATLGYL